MKELFSSEVFEVAIDKEKYTAKPSSWTIGGISKRISNNPQRLTLEQLAKSIEEGQSYLPCKLKDGTERKGANWESQNLFVLDIDEGMTLQVALEHEFIRSNATFCIQLLVTPNSIINLELYLRQIDW